MRRALAGIETEYGLLVDGRGAEDQIEDATALVRSYPGECVLGWDYRFESPRADLRGFKLDRLAFDPEDAKFDAERPRRPDEDTRADRVLPNGARLYNDHGHPEYATPECFSAVELARHDRAGQEVVRSCAAALEQSTGRRVSVYKNNTDFHGASYGTHESYLAPRSLGFDGLYRAVMPMLVVRQVLTGAGKVGSETGRACAFQLSQRADFFAESANAETLFRRPVFNTRDEPHGNPAEWIRLHVISGDANMIWRATARKVGLVKLAIRLAEADQSPDWPIADPVRAFQAISRDETQEFCVELAGRRWSNAREVLEAYFAAAEATLELEPEEVGLIAECRGLLQDLVEKPERFARSVDWAAKRLMLEQIMEAEGLSWRSEALRAYDLEYHNIDPDDGLFHALVKMEQVEEDVPAGEVQTLHTEVREDTRAAVRALAVTRFPHHVVRVSWGTLSMHTSAGVVELSLPPDLAVPPQLTEAWSVEEFVAILRGDL